MKQIKHNSWNNYVRKRKIMNRIKMKANAAVWIAHVCCKATIKNLLQVSQLTWIAKRVENSMRSNSYNYIQPCLTIHNYSNYNQRCQLFILIHERAIDVSIHEMRNTMNSFASQIDNIDGCRFPWNNISDNLKKPSDVYDNPRHRHGLYTYISIHIYISGWKSLRRESHLNSIERAVSPGNWKRIILLRESAFVFRVLL